MLSHNSLFKNVCVCVFVFVVSDPVPASERTYTIKDLSSAVYTLWVTASTAKGESPTGLRSKVKFFIQCKQLGKHTLLSHKGNRFRTTWGLSGEKAKGAVDITVGFLLKLYFSGNVKSDITFWSLQEREDNDLIFILGQAVCWTKLG